MQEKFSSTRPPRTIAELDEPETVGENALRLAGARVVAADRRLLARDFPQLETAAVVARDRRIAALRGERRAAAVREVVDRWLVAHAAVVSRRQAAQREVNTAIATTGEGVRVFRPPRYGRTVVVPIRGRRRTGGDRGPPWPDEPAGLLEVKGAGVARRVEPFLDPHADGLMLLGEALADLAVERVVAAALRRVGGRFRVVPTYAILDPGFDNLCAGGGRGPAGLQVRRAHRRPRGGAELPDRGSREERVKFEIEMLLRHFGITSANHGTRIELREVDGEEAVFYGGDRETDFWTAEEQLAAFRAESGENGPRRWEAINVQLAREVGARPARARLVDFGHYRVRGSFELPVVSAVGDRVLRWGGSLAPDEPLFVQPDPALALPAEHWGELTAEEQAAAREREPGLLNDALTSRLHLRAFELARRFRAGEIGSDEVAAAIDVPVAAAVAKWDGVGKRKK